MPRRCEVAQACEQAHTEVASDKLKGAVAKQKTKEEENLYFNGQLEDHIVLRRRLAAECAEVAALERMLEAAEVCAERRTFAAARAQGDRFEVHSRTELVQLESEVACEERNEDQLTGTLRRLVAEASALVADTEACRAEMVNVRKRSSACRASFPTLLDEATAAENASATLTEELFAENKRHDVLERRYSTLRSEDAAARYSSRLLRQKLEDGSVGIAWLKKSARTHVEDLRFCCENLEQHVSANAPSQPSLPVSAVAAAPLIADEH